MKAPASPPLLVLVFASIAMFVSLYMPHANAAAPLMVAKSTKAPDLAGNLRQAVASIGKAVKDDGGKQFNPKKKSQEPFFAALKKTNRNVTALAGYLKARNAKEVFPSLDRTGRSINELEAAYALSGSKNPRMDEGIAKLGGAFKALRRNFGKEALRVKKGGALTPKETQQIAGLEDKYRKVLAELNKVKAKASGSKFGKAPSNLTQITTLIDSLTGLLATSGTTPARYVDLLLFDDDLQGSWYAISSYVSLVDPTEYSTFSVLDTYIVDLDTYADTVDDSFTFEDAEYWAYCDATAIDTTESYDISISETEITSIETYVEETTVEVSVDEFDLTVGSDDVALLDHDGDGIVDSVDTDDDNDGIPDAKDLDDDGDGVDDVLEVDADNDGTPDALDDDDDNDGIDDAQDPDDDNDGIADAKDNDNDNDNDGIPDAKDPDDDNDGIDDAKDDDDDGDGIDDADDADDDNDGVDDDDDADHDDDGDGTPDDEDADDDNDGTPDDADNDDDGDGVNDADEDDSSPDDDGDDAPEDDGDGAAR